MKNLVNLDLEKQVIGGLLNDRESYIDVALELSPEDFSSGEMAKIYETFHSEYASSSFVDTATLVAKSGARIQTLTECMEVGWIVVGMKQKARKLVELAHKRRVHRECTLILKDLHTLGGEEIAARLSGVASSISLQSEKKQVYDASALIKRVQALQETRKQDPGYIRGIRSGYPVFDKTVRGFRSRRMTVLAAATGFGKSTLALNLFTNIVMAGHRALFISCENDADDNLDRMCGIASNLDLKDVEGGANSLRVWTDFQRAFSGKSMFLSDNSPRNVDEICATISRYAIQHQVEIVFLDYIGEISGECRNGETEEMKLARQTQKLLDTAKSMNIHLVLLAQLNRQGNRRGRPTVGELAGCFRIAQKAHSLLIFWQEENKQDVLTVDKNRQGPRGIDIAVSFDRGKQTIKEVGLWSSTSKEILK